MPTEYDVFAELIKHAPCKAKDLPFREKVYAHLNSLVKKGWVKISEEKYIPVKNNVTTHVFNIIKYCLKSSLEYNLFLSKNMQVVITELNKNTPKLRPELLKNNRLQNNILHYLEENQFILVNNLKPKEGLILKHQLLDDVLSLNNISLKTKYLNFEKIADVINHLDTNEINPFEDDVFSFLSGSAQLEGSTINFGETKEIILNDIYPNKPQKDVQMVKNLNEALRYILKNIDEEITQEKIKEINRLVMFSLHANAGEYKKNQNKIFGNPNFKTTIPERVLFDMTYYCDELSKIKTANDCLNKLGYIHNELQRIHPFSDGNSRTTRIILNWMLLKFKLPLLVLKMGCFDEYLNQTKMSDARDDERLTGLFHHILLHEQLIGKKVTK